jgi:H+/Cl- antiporter ClcA
MVVTLTASIAVINYTEDHYALIPALIGAFAGTWLGMKINKTNES